MWALLGTLPATFSLLFFIDCDIPSTWFTAFKLSDSWPSFPVFRPPRSPLLLISVELHFLIRYIHPFSTRTLLKLFRWTHWCRFPGRFVAGLIGIDDGNLNARRPSRLRPAAGAVRTRRGPRGSNRSQPADSIMAQCGPFSTCKWVDSPADIGGPPAPRPPPPFLPLLPTPSPQGQHRRADQSRPTFQVDAARSAGVERGVCFDSVAWQWKCWVITSVRLPWQSAGGGVTGVRGVGFCHWSDWCSSLILKVSKSSTLFK